MLEFELHSSYIDHKLFTDWCWVYSTEVNAISIALPFDVFQLFPNSLKGCSASELKGMLTLHSAEACICIDALMWSL